MGTYGKMVLRIAAAVVLLSPVALAQSKPGGPERILFDAANQERMAKGREPLRWDSSLADAARLHAIAMARHNAISHQFAGEQTLSARASTAGARFSIVAENVAEAPSARTIHELWMKSPPHRENLLDPQLNSLGIAVAERAGQLFAVEDFSRSVAALSLEAQEQVVRARLRVQGLRLLEDSAEARRACRLGNNYQPGRQPMFLMHYSATDLGDLPQPLEQKVQSGQYHAAAVGACPSSDSGGFADYQITVLLYE